jgi:quercetin dioxygenase-like cupin family protein
MIEKIYPYTLEAPDLFEHVVKEENFQLNHVVIEPGKFFPKHPTDAKVNIIIIAGQLSITLGTQEKTSYEKGMVIEVPKGTESVLGNDSNEKVEVFVIKRFE